MHILQWHEAGALADRKIGIVKQTLRVTTPVLCAQGLRLQ